jgi:hypothetical protein
MKSSFLTKQKKELFMDEKVRLLSSTFKKEGS